MKKILLFIAVLISGISQAQIVNIPDTNFKNILLSANTSNFIAQDINDNSIVIDSNNDGEIQINEALNVYKLDVRMSNISDLSGIEAFINITLLGCHDNQLTSLDVSSLTNLRLLRCYNNQLSSLDLSNLTNLDYLFCTNNQLSSLNVSNLAGLIQISCFENQLSSLDLSGLTNLQFLLCASNQLSSLDLSSLTNLYHFECDDNQFSSLDLSNLTNLGFLLCSDNQLSSLDLSNQTNFETLVCSDNPDLTYINLKNGNNAFFDASYSKFENLPSLNAVCVDELNTSLTALIQSQTNQSVDFYTNCSALAVNENTLLEFSVYPTPTENILNVKSKIGIVKIEIYSNLGQLILKNTMENKIEISSLTQGLYFVKVEDANGNFSVKKIMKK